MITIRNHLVENKDIFDPAVDSMLEGITAKMLYVDPPWGDGSVKYWATMNRKMTGAESMPHSFGEMIDRIIALSLRHVDGYVVILNGLQWEGMIRKKMQVALFNIQTIPLIYTGKNLKYSLLVGVTSPDYKRLPVPVEKKGYPATKEIIGSVTEAGDTVIDPCCGMGYTAQSCVDQGLRFVGNEFNIKRLEKTLARLGK